MTTTQGSRLDRDTVVRVAADLADSEGWSSVTLSRVAKEVDRHVTSLYTHVESIADLQHQVAVLALDELTEQVWRAALGQTGRDALRAIAEVYRDFGRDHPGRSAAIRDSGIDDEIAEHGRRLAEGVWAVLRSFGLDDDRAVAAHAVFSATMNGLVHTGRGDTAFDDAVRLFEVALATGEWP